MYDCKEALRRIDAVIAQGPYTDTWESLSNWQPPEWYRNAKFGIFIDWGVYSVPAFENEWYPRNMYIEGSKVFEHHAKTYGAHKDFGYKDFIPLFKAEKFDPAAWAALFKRAGARYVVPVAEHHDGFQMYKSALSHWNAAEMGPQRDVVGALKDAVEAEGMTLGVSSHRIEHWFFMGGGKNFESDIPQNPDRDDRYWPSMASPENTDDLFGAPGPDAEFLDDWLVRTCELIDSYRPRILYFDWWIQHANAKPYLKRLAAYYYNRAAEWGMEVAIDYKHDAFLFGTAVPDIERGQMADIKPYFWQTDTAIALNSWCYTENNDFRPAEDILCDLVDIVSKNGCLLLNVGPKADGTISDEDTAVLTAIGGWMAVNGEAIYGTHVWKTFGEGPTKVQDGHYSDAVKKNFTSEDFRFTAKGDKLYAAAMKPSESGEYCIRSLRMQAHTAGTVFHGLVGRVEVLGTDAAPEWTRDAEGLHIRTDFSAEGPVVFRITLNGGEPEYAKNAFQAGSRHGGRRGADGLFDLVARAVRLRHRRLHGAEPSGFGETRAFVRHVAGGAEYRAVSPRAGFRAQAHRSRHVCQHAAGRLYLRLFQLDLGHGAAGGLFRAASDARPRGRSGAGAVRPRGGGLHGHGPRRGAV